MAADFYPFLGTDHSLHRDFKVITKLQLAEELKGNSKLVSNLGEEVHCSLPKYFSY